MLSHKVRNYRYCGTNTFTTVFGFSYNQGLVEYLLGTVQGNVKQRNNFKHCCQSDTHNTQHTAGSKFLLHS